MTKEQIIERLRNDDDYYGSFGRQFLSNSDIGKLISNPQSFGLPTPKTLAMLQGDYFHKACLEPHKVKDIVLVDASTRTTIKYKNACEASGTEFLLLEREAEEVKVMVESLRANRELSSLVWGEFCKYETPILGDVLGKQFKGKVDIINNGFIYDLKTTSNLDEFKYSAKKYNYDSQTVIYEQLTGFEMAFVVIEKNTNRLGLFHVTDDFRQSGWNKVAKAIEMYDRYYGENPTQDINQYYLDQFLF